MSQRMTANAIAQKVDAAQLAQVRALGQHLASRGVTMSNVQTTTTGSVSQGGSNLGNMAPPNTPTVRTPQVGISR